MKEIAKNIFFALSVLSLPLGLGAMEHSEATQVAEAYHDDGGYGPIDSKAELGDVDDQVTSQDKVLRKYEIAVAERLIAIVCDKNLTDEAKRRALELALQTADVNAKDRDGRTPLHFACSRNNNLAMVKYLVGQGADVNAVILGGLFYKGFTPLHCACSNNNLDQVEYLIGQGAGVNAKDVNGWTLLHRACNSLGMVKCLVEQGVDINAVITDDLYKGWTSLHFACSNNDLAMVKYLVGQGADVNAVITDGIYKNRWRPLLFGCLYNNLGVVKCLVEQGAGVDAKNEHDKTPRGTATHPKVKSYLEMVEDFYAVNAKTMTFEAFAKKYLINANMVKYETAKELMAEIAQTGGLSLQKRAEIQKCLKYAELTLESDRKSKVFADYARMYTSSGNTVRMDNIADIYALLHLGRKHFFDAFSSFVEKHGLLDFSGGECGEMGPERHWMLFDCATRRGPQRDLWLKECFALIGKEYPFEKTSVFEEAVTKYLSKLPAKEQERLTKEKNELVQKKNMFLAIPQKPGQTPFARPYGFTEKCILAKGLKIKFHK
ncbi:MAG: ankyrin repeat domain-containing protein [Candidatus Dependentiae bacterium]|nr:ankyrin repeat domain-containing protein [Candidatus Dependentiae bacterium]